MAVLVVIPVHGPAPYLESSLRTVVAQTHPFVRVVVVDDRAAADLERRVRAVAPRAEVLRSRGSGVSAARNTGIASGSEPLIAFLDSDDLWVAHKLEHQVAELVRSEQTGVACSAFLEFYDGEVTARRPRRTSFAEGNALEAVILDDLVIPSTALCRRQLLEAAGGFPDGHAYFEDFALFWRLARMAPFKFSAEPLALYRRHVAQATQVFSSDVLRARSSLTAQALTEVGAGRRLRRRVEAHDLAVAGHWHRRQGRRGAALLCAVRAVERWPGGAEPYALMAASALPPPVESAARAMSQARRAREDLSPAVRAALDADHERPPVARGG